MFFDRAKECAAQQQNPLSLAFLGDAVFTLYVRERLCKENDGKSGALHSLASKSVSAGGQAVLFDVVKDLLTEREADIARRARNAHTANVPKHSDLETYKKATALEAVIGYLYIIGDFGRLSTLLSYAAKE